MKRSRIWAFLVSLLVSALAGGTPAAAQRQGDGITVHGHWTIDIHNPDGALASHHEFENALVPVSGATSLSGLLARSFAPTGWQLELSAADGTGACARAASTGQPTLTVTPPPTINPQAPVFTGAPTRPNLTTWIVPASGSGFEVNIGSGAPANFSTVASNPGELDFTWDPANTSPGTYVFTVAISPGGPDNNTYTFTLTVPQPTAPQPQYPCSAVEAGTTIPADLANAWFQTLAFTLTNGGATLEVTGNITAANPVAIEQVRSLLILSNASVSPFSARTLQTPIQVVAGQKIYVKVVFSFS
jgi:hypothetical protein